MGNCLTFKNEVNSPEQSKLSNSNSNPIATKNRFLSNSSKYTVAILIVGNSQVGKSTIVRQLKNLAGDKLSGISMYDHNGTSVVQCPYSASERTIQKLTVHNHVLKLIKNVALRCPRTDTEFSLQTEISEQFSGELELTNDISSKISKLMKNKSVRKTSDNQRRNLNVSADSVEYFLTSEKLQEIAGENYVPSVQDILLCHHLTSAHFEDCNFKIADAYCSVRDMNGDPKEFSHLPQLATEWMQENKMAATRFVVFVVSLSDYNQESDYFSGNTKLDETVKLLQLLVSIMLEIRDIKQTKLVLLFNKTDVFERKLAKSGDFDEFIKRYTKQDCSSRLSWAEETGKIYAEKAREYVANMVFDSIAGSVKTDGAFCCRFLNATDPDDVKDLAKTLPKKDAFCMIGDLYN